MFHEVLQEGCVRANRFASGTFLAPRLTCRRCRDREPVAACALADDPSPIAFLLILYSLFRLGSSPFPSRENDTPVFWSEVIQARIRLKFATYSPRQVTGSLVRQYHARATLDNPSAIILSKQMITTSGYGDRDISKCGYISSCCSPCTVKRTYRRYCCI